MPYGNRSYGVARYGRMPARTFFETFSEQVVLNGSLLNQVNLQETLIASDDSVKTVGALRSEDVYLNDSASVFTVLSRFYQEDVVFDSVDSSSALFSRSASEAVRFNDLSSKNIVTSVSEDIYLEENSVKNLTVFKSEDFYLDDGNAVKDVARTVGEDVFLDPNRFSTVGRTVKEDVFLDEIDLDRGTNIIRIFVRNYSEDVVLNDEEYLLSLVRGVGVPELITDQLERYGLDLDAEELNIDTEVTGDGEDSGSL